MHSTLGNITRPITTRPLQSRPRPKSSVSQLGGRTARRAGSCVAFVAFMSLEFEVQSRPHRFVPFQLAFIHRTRLACERLSMLLCNFKHGAPQRCPSVLLCLALSVDVANHTTPTRPVYPSGERTGWFPSLLTIRLASPHSKAISLSRSTPGKYIHTPNCRDHNSPVGSSGLPHTANSSPCLPESRSTNSFNTHSLSAPTLCKSIRAKSMRLRIDWRFASSAVVHTTVSQSSSWAARTHR